MCSEIKRWVPLNVSRRRFLILLCLTAVLHSTGYCSWQSTLVYRDESGRLVYTEDAEGNRIPDFSHAGYRGGGVELPEVPVKKTISPIPGDNTAHIQAAINEVAAMYPDADGFWGAVLLEAGEYTVNGTITIAVSGVVLRGVGDGADPASNTVLHRTDRNNQAPLVSVTPPNPGDSYRWPEKQILGTRTNITTDWVKVGTNSFDVVSSAGYSVGDTIVVFHPATQAWIDAVNRGDTASDSPWSASDSAVHRTDIAYFRYITGISGTTITIHAPVFNHLRRSLSQSYIYKFDRSGLITEVGVQSLRVLVDTNGPEATGHAEYGIVLEAVENGWVDSVTVLHPSNNNFRFLQSFHITCQNCQGLEPHSPISGGYRANFTSDGSQFLLVKDCLATDGRHAFVVNGAGKDSGNVFLDSLAINPYATSEGHRRWTNGNLWDNVVFEQVNSSRDVILLGNRGSWGTGHGWASVHSVAWNCDAEDGHIHVEQPPTAQNYGIGCFGAAVNGPGPFGHPQGFVEGTNQPGLEPRSLYLGQLEYRLRGAGVLAGHWEFNETSGIIASDSSANDNDGTLYYMTDTDWVSGSLDFDGIDDFVRIPCTSNLNLTAGFTISALIEPNTVSKLQRIVGKVLNDRDKQYALSISNDGKLLFEYERADNDFSLSGGTVVPSQWQHVAVTVDNSLGIRLFIDGEEVASGTAPRKVSPTLAPVCIGHQWSDLTGRGHPFVDDYFDGLIDEVVIFNVALSQNEMVQLYTQGTNSFKMPCGQIQLEENLTLAGDISRDCAVDWNDLLMLVENWLVDGILAEDIHRDSKVDLLDFVQLAANWNLYIAPSAPANLSALPDSVEQIDLNWDDNEESNFDYYRIYRSADSGFSPGLDSLIADGLTDSMFSDTGLLPDTTYYYRVTAVNTAGFESYACDEISATTYPLDLIPSIKACIAGAEQQGNWKENSYDGNTFTRWANDGQVGSAWIEYDLGQSWEITGIRLLMYRGTSRTYPIDITVDGVLAWSGSTSTTSGYWEQSFTPTSGRRVRLTMTGNNSDGRGWFTIYETEIVGE